MKISVFLLVSMLCVYSVFAEPPTIESLTQKIEALEQQIAELQSELAAKIRSNEGADFFARKGRSEIILNILKDGKIRAEGREITDKELVEKLLRISEVFPNQPVRIRGDKDTKYGDVVRVIDLCQKSGIWNISFATGKQTVETGEVNQEREDAEE